MRRYLLPIVLVLVLSLGFQSCGRRGVGCAHCEQGAAQWDRMRVSGSGEVAREERPVEGIRRVNLATIGTLYIEVGDSEELHIEAAQRKLPELLKRIDWLEKEVKSLRSQREGK